MEDILYRLEKESNRTGWMDLVCSKTMTDAMEEIKKLRAKQDLIDGKKQIIELLRIGLVKIAHGKLNCGRPLASLVSQDTARKTLLAAGITKWKPEERKN
ncbi:MAG: hypothetical protein V3V73_05970 [Gammaproteobacteria bacterium]